jgi:hypothetical protein
MGACIKPKDLGDGLLEVASDTRVGQTYTVDTRYESCTCKGFQYRGNCKHLQRAVHEIAEAQREQLRHLLILVG